MNLYILRHGEAVNQAESDFDRVLTEQGCSDILNVAQQFIDKNHPLESCYVSPYPRAQQTANLFISEISKDLPIHTCRKLVPEVRAGELMTFIDSLNSDNVLLVSHNPLLSELLALLTQGNISDLKIVSTAELHAITFEEAGHGQGELQFSLSPLHHV